MLNFYMNGSVKLVWNLICLGNPINVCAADFVLFISEEYVFPDYFEILVVLFQEFWCIIHGFLYFLAIPSMSMLLMLYSLGNLHIVSWGTREAPKRAGNFFILSHDCS